MIALPFPQCFQLNFVSTETVEVEQLLLSVALTFSVFI